MTPCSRMLAASVSSAASSIRRRGCRGLARIRSSGISTEPGRRSVLRCGMSAAEAAAEARGDDPADASSRRPCPVRAPVRAIGPDPELLGKCPIGLAPLESGRSARSPGRGWAPRTGGRSAGSRSRRRGRRGGSGPRRRPRRRGSSGRRTSSGPRPRSRARVEVVADEVDRGDELGQALQGVVLALDRDQRGIRRGQGVDRQEAERGRAVDEDVVVVLPDRVEERARRRSRCSSGASSTSAPARAMDEGTRRQARRRGGGDERLEARLSTTAS